MSCGLGCPICSLSMRLLDAAICVIVIVALCRYNISLQLVSLIYASTLECNITDVNERQRCRIYMSDDIRMVKSGDGYSYERGDTCLRFLCRLI